jgi:hypothetical protein
VLKTTQVNPSRFRSAHWKIRPVIIGIHRIHARADQFVHITGNSSQYLNFTTIRHGMKNCQSPHHHNPTKVSVKNDLPISDSEGLVNALQDGN